jgi:sigma-B regulation protein RsbU (phosphoserine phosphatase)
MTSVPYRYLRRKLPSWLPTTILGKITAYIGAIWLAVHVSRLAVLVLRPSSDAMSSWASAFNIIFGVFLTLVILRWFRRVLLWRLRNRLIVTYVFIGVIPVLLILVMVGVAGYMISNQYATSQARVQMEADVHALRVAAESQATRLTESPNLKMLPPEENYLLERFPGMTEAAWKNGKRESLGQASDLELPTWLKEDSFRGVVVEQGKLYIRTLATAQANGNRATVIMSVPITKELLDRSVKTLGEVKLHLARRVRRDRQKNGVAITVDDQGKDSDTQLEMQSDPAVVGGAVPVRSQSYWDPELTFWSYSPYKTWKTGEDTGTGMVITTRLSALVARLFENTGQYSTAAMILLAITAIFLGLIEVVALFFGVGLTRTITMSVSNLYKATQEINKGNLKHRIPVKNTDQLASLQLAFNSMSENLEKLIEEQKEKERLENELAIAQEVQETLFPRQSVEIKALEVHGICRPARTVSGDYYDFLTSGDDQIAIAVGDISGKGISAALLMASVHSAVRAYEYGRMPERSELVHAGAAAITAASSVGGGRDYGVRGAMQSPANVVELLNRHLFNSTQAEKYATLFLGVYDSHSRKLNYCNAGHLPPVIVRNDGTLYRLTEGGTVIGLFDGIVYEEDSVQLSPGDIFIAFSDGVTEPENEFGEFGEERLIDLVQQNRKQPLARISETVIGAVQDWIGAAEQPDDVTLVLARVQ